MQLGIANLNLSPPSVEMEEKRDYRSMQKIWE